MNQNHTLLESGIIRHSIDSFAATPALCPYFQPSIEGIHVLQSNQQGTNNQKDPTTRGNNSRGSVTRQNSGRIQGDNSNFNPLLVNETVWILMKGKIILVAIVHY